MMAALIVLSVFTLPGACFPSAPPSMSDLRQHIRH
jgi:hypothetical protein